MPSINITLTDTPTGGVAVHTDFKPAVGSPCSPAQSAALDIISRTRKEFGLPNVTHCTGDASPLPTAASQQRHYPAEVPFRVGGVDIDAVHRTRDGVVQG